MPSRLGLVACHMASDIDQLDLCGLADAIAVGDVTAVAATEHALVQLEGTGRALNAIVRLDAEFALAQAEAADHTRTRGAPRQLLQGVPLAHKDVFYRAGHLSEGGSKIRLGFRPAVTATVLQRLDAAGAIDCGQLQMSEFAMSPTGYNEHHGPALNPWGHGHVAGGSSSGSGVAVAAGLVTGSLGTDTGGSLRHPGAMCGLVGLKPTWGLVPTDGVMPLSASLDCVGPLARTARDAARLLSVIAQDDFETGIAGGVKGLTLAVPGGYYRARLTPEIETALQDAIRVFREAGMTIVESKPPDMGPINTLMHILLSVEAATLHKTWLLERPQDYASQVRARIEPGLFYAATRYVEALSLRASVTQAWLESAMPQADLAFLPAISFAVPTISSTIEGAADDVARIIGDITHCTRAINYLGLPAASVPCGFDSAGLPIAFQLVGRPFQERVLLKAAHAFQGLTDWHLQRPIVLSGATAA